MMADERVRQLRSLALLVEARNSIDSAIAELIGRPAGVGHIGEYVASVVFGIELETSAVKAGYDGRFMEGRLAGRTVNIKLYGKRESLLDINERYVPEFYLVLTGPKANPGTSRLTTRPIVIDKVFLFDAQDLINAQITRGAKLGDASSVLSRQWSAARVYPRPETPPLQLSELQVSQLQLFSSPVSPTSTAATRR
jgi:hypothetical protein